MSISTVFGCQILVSPNSSSQTIPIGGKSNVLGLVIENSSRPQKKGTAHHMKTRPKKTQPWDIRRKPTAYAPLPPLPPDWTPVSDATAAGGDDVNASSSAVATEDSASSAAQEAPVTSG